MITLRGAVRKVLGGSAPTAPAAASGGRISWETVQSVTGLNACVVLGHTLPVTGLAAFPVGARVPVAWRNGTPVAVIGHRTRRAQFHPSRRVSTNGIVEELLVGNFDNTAVGIWYRTHDRLEAITDKNGTPLRTLPQSSTPSSVKWGLDGKSFGVQCSNGVYAVYVLQRDDPNVVDPASPGPATLYWTDRPLEDTTSLTAVSFLNRVKKSFRWWIGKCFITTVYQAASMYGVWYWFGAWGGMDQGWETTVSGEGSASVNAEKTFPLKQVLSGGITDWYGNANCHGAVSEWFLDTDLHLKFLITVEWDFFWLGTNATGVGSIHYPFGLGGYGMDGWDEQIVVGGTALGCIGAKRQNQQTVPETHLFLWDAWSKSVAWSTASAAPMLGAEQLRFSPGILEHNKRIDPGYSASGLPNPHAPGDKAPSTVESYYGGANWSNLPLTLYAQNDPSCGDERSTLISNTGTHQLFDPAKLSCITGPFISVGSGLYPWSVSMIGGYSANYRVNYSTRTGATQRLWHYRMQYAKVFTRRYVSGGLNPLATGVDEALLFIVVERYPYISGTGYINDLPQIWIGIVTPQGQTVQVLRDWQYGLSGASLVSGNGHRVIWVLQEGAILPKSSYRVTTALGEERSFTTAELEEFLKSQPKLYTPDFLWDRAEPQMFLDPAGLPTLTQDDVLTDFAALLAVEGAPEGSVRVMNDEEILDPLERYLTT